MEWNERDGVRWLAAELGDGGRAAFSTRLGGVSEPPFDRLNLGVLTDDQSESVLRNRGRLAAALGLDPARIAFARQVHGAEIEAHDPTAAGVSLRCSFTGEAGAEAPQRPGRGGAASDADGQVSTGPGLAGLVFTADCLPVVLAGPGGVAVLHCGWRGLAAGIIASGAERVGARSAAIGPGIGPCCFEVGDEVLDAFAGLGEGTAVDGPEGRPGDDEPSRRHLDLPEVARRLLAEAGVERVESAGLCTYCEAGLFFSHRRDHGRTGRQAGLGWIEAA